MFDKIRRKAKRAIKKAVGDTVEDEVDRQVSRKTREVKRQYQQQIDEAVDDAYKGMKVSKKVKGKMITNFKAFQKSWEKSADDPSDSVFHFLMAIYNYCKDPAKGEPMTTVVLSKKHNQKSSGSPSGLKLGPTNRRLLNHMREDNNIIKSYLGASYKEDYKFDEKNLEMSLVTKEIDDEYATVVIQSGGKDLPTPVALAKNKNNQWKIVEFSSIATGCRKPASVEGDF
jgi:hypothetical protein